MAVKDFGIISPDQKQRVDHGDLVQWKRDNDNEICIVSYDRLVSLKNPYKTWSSVNDEEILDYVEDFIDQGLLERLPAGTEVTVTYVNE